MVRTRLPLLAMAMLLAVIVIPSNVAAANDCRVVGPHAMVAELNSDGDVVDGYRHRFDDVACRESIRDLPVGLSILHRADGRLVEASRLAAADGTVTTEVLMRSLTAERATVAIDGPNGIEHREVTYGLPLMTVITISYPDGWSVQPPAQHGISIQSSGGQTTVNYAALLFAPLTADAFKLVVEATPGRGVPTVSMRAAPIGHIEHLGIPENLLSTDDYAVIAAFTELAYDGARELVDGIDELADGTRELADGTAELADGTRELADGTGEYADGIREVADAMPDLVDGANEIAEGTDELLDGLIALVDGLAEFADQLDTVATGGSGLADALGEIGDAYDDVAMMDAMGASTEIATLYVLLTAMFAPDNVPTLPLPPDQLDPLISQTAGQDPLDQSARGLATGLRALADALDDLVVELGEDDGLIDGVGLLADGTAEFADGIGELADGLLELANAADEIADGTAELADGTDELADGTAELADGVDELAEGVAEFPDALVEIMGVADRANLARATTTAVLQAGAERAAASSLITVELTAAGHDPIHPATPIGLGLAGLGIVAIYTMRRRVLGLASRLVTRWEAQSW